MRCATLLTGGTLAAKEFGETVLGLTKRVQWLHKDEVSPELSFAIANQTLPCVVADLGGRIELLLDCAELESCNGDFAVFEKLLQEKITEFNILRPSSTTNHDHKKERC